MGLHSHDPGKSLCKVNVVKDLAVKSTHEVCDLIIHSKGKKGEFISLYFKVLKHKWTAKMKDELQQSNWAQ